MKAYRLEVLVVDFDGLGGAGVRDALENVRFPNDCISPRIMSVEERDIGPWSDDHPLNHTSTAKAEYERLFALPASAPEGARVPESALGGTDKSDLLRALKDNHALNLPQRSALYELVASAESAKALPLRQAVADHIADLRRCVVVLAEHRFAQTASEISKAADELAAALAAPLPSEPAAAEQLKQWLSKYLLNETHAVACEKIDAITALASSQGSETEALERLYRWARVVAGGPTGYSGDHPIAQAERALASKGIL